MKLRRLPLPALRRSACVHCLVFWLVCSSQITLFSQASEPLPDKEPPSINLLQVDQQIFLGIVPRSAKLSDAFEPFDLVIDLRYPYEGANTERSKLHHSQASYRNISTSSRSPSVANVTALEATLAEFPDHKILIHDSNGRRSALVWAAHLVNIGVPLNKAVESTAQFIEPNEAKSHLAHYLAERTQKRSQPAIPHD